MTPEQQQIAIAEACGWTEIEIKLSTFAFFGKTINCYGRNPETGNYRCLPLYHSNLNAIHDALAKLPRSLRGTFNDNLAKRVGGKMCEVANDDDMLFQFATATAAQRAEAFLRTLNLWTTG